MYRGVELAKKYGFYLYDKRDDGWETYTLDQKKEVKHAMAYNRWMYSDELYHHGIKGQKWGERHGPPYPLDSSLSDGSKLLPKATGSPQTKKKYKTSEKTAYQRKKRQEKIESSPDYQEKHSVGAELKRKYRAFKKEQKARQEAAEEKRANDEKAWSEAADRLNKSSIPWEERKKILEEIAESDYSMYNSGRYATHPVWGNRPDRGLDADKLNKAIDDYESKQAAARDAAKEHGTAEEVMKFRDTFSKEEWDSIASRLESEARVRKLLDKPLQSFDNGGNKQNQNSGNSPNQSKAVNAPENSKLKKIYEKGTAREVYQNRDKFTVEQLEAIEKRLSAEEEIGKRANNQVFLTPERIKRLEQVRDAVKIMGDIALTANKVNKAFNSGNTSTSSTSDKKAKSDDTSTSDKKAKSDDTSTSSTSKKKVRTEMSGVDKDAVYSVKFTGSDKIHKVVGSKLKDFVNKEGREVESAYVADSKKKNESRPNTNSSSTGGRNVTSIKTDINTRTKQKPSYNMGKVLKVLKTVEQVSIDEEHIRKYKSQRRDSEPQTAKSSRSSDVSKINDWIDRLSKVELISVDEKRAGQIHPLERVGRTFTDEERKKR